MAKVKVESLDEIVFAQRNKAYGAYELRKRYNRIVTRALLIAMLIVTVATVWPLIASKLAASHQKAIERNVLAEMINAKAAKEELPPPPPPPKVDAPKIETVKYTAPVVVDSVDETKQIATADDAISTAVNADIDTARIEVVVQQVDEVVQEEKKQVFEIVEEMPEFTGGEEALRKYLAENTHYPTIARENGIEGRVFVRFVVTDRGSVDQVSIARGVDPNLDAEAIRVVRSLPKWKPGKQRGEAVNVWYTVPISFVLSK
jgi:periplasmic protein TonB